MDSIVEPLRLAVAPFAAWVQAVNPAMTDTPHTDAGGVQVWWFTPPDRMVVAWLVHNAILLTLVLWLSRGAWVVEVGPRAKAASSEDVWRNAAKDATTDASRVAAADAVAAARSATTTRRSGGCLCLSPGALAAVDYTLRALCFVNMAAILWYKLPTGRLVYVFQPCHMTNAILCLLCLLPPGGFADSVFCFTLNFLYGTILALATPDLRGLDRPGEQLNFFTQHAMLLLLPAVWIARRKFTLYGGLRLSVLQWAFAFLLHWNVYLPISVALDGNVNYMMVPPKVWPRTPYTPVAWYRETMGTFCLLLTLLSRFVIVEGVVVASGVRHEWAAERAALADAVPLVSPKRDSPKREGAHESEGENPATPHSGRGSGVRRRGVA